MLIRLLAILFLAGSALADYIPADYKQWQDSNNPRKRAATIGGMLSNYPDTDSTWAAVENDWITVDGLHTNRRAVLKTDINDAGQSTISVTMDGSTYTVSQRLLKVIWINTNTHNWTDIADVTWNTPSVDSNIVKWQGVIPGVDYRVRKLPGQVQHGIFFKPGFLDSAVTLYDQRSDSSDIALGNVMAYTLLGADHSDSAVGNMDRRLLKQIGKYAFSLNRQFVHFPGSDTLPPIPVRQRWIKQNGKIYCVEYVMMSAIKRIHEALPSATIWHNDNTIIEDDEFQMAGVRKYASTTNFGSDVSILLSNSEAPNDTRVGQLLPDLSAISAGSNIDSVRLTLFSVWSVYVGVDYGMTAIAPEWNEASPMSFDSAGVGLDWTTGSWSTSDLSGSQELSNARTGETQDAVWNSSDGDPIVEAVQGTLDGSFYGFALYLEGSGGTAEWHTEDAVSASKHPEMYVEFTTSAGGDISYVRRIKEGEGK